MDKRFIGINDLAQYLDVSAKTVRAWVWQRKIPYCKMGRLVKFDLKKVDEWTKKNSVEVLGDC